jgi:hypothetical protein
MSFLKMQATHSKPGSADFLEFSSFSPRTFTLFKTRQPLPKDIFYNLTYLPAILSPLDFLIGKARDASPVANFPFLS